MSPLFVDSFYFFAILNPNDAAHSKAVQFSKERTAPLVTTSSVMTEVADGLARSAHRAAVRRLVSQFRAAAANEIVAMSDELFEEGLHLYDTRPDSNGR